MEFLCKKTFELSELELQQVTDLFNRVFEKDATPAFMKSQYVNNPLGFSYHSMMTDNDTIVGFCSYVPAYYFYEGTKMLFASAGDYMTDKPYRDFFNFRDIIKNAHSFLKAEGVVLNFGYPNDKAYPVMTKGKLTKPIGKMHTYVLPYRIGGIKQGLAWLNLASIIFCRCWVILSALFASNIIAEFSIHKDEDSFNPTRYKRFDGVYGIGKLKYGEFHYKLKGHEGVRTAFIIDVSPKSSRNYVDAVRYLLKHHSKEFDLVLYPGELPFGFTGMIKLPRMFEPKMFNFTANIIDKEAVDPNIVYDIKNWDTNLSNFDLI